MTADDRPSFPAADPTRWPEAAKALQAGDLDACLAMTECVIGAYGPLTDWVILQARALAARQDFAAALAALLAGLAAQPRAGRLWELAAAVWDAAGGWDTSRACLARLRELGLTEEEAPRLTERLATSPAGGEPAPASWQQVLAQPAPPPTLGACLVVGDDWEFVPDCLASLQGFDDVVIVDTAGRPETAVFAERFRVRRGSFPGSHDRAGARNTALALTVTDWVLMIDADERFVGGTAAVRRAIEAHGGGRALLAPRIEAPGEDDATAPLHLGRLFARVPGRHFVGAVDERLVDDGQGTLATCLVAGWHLRRVRPQAGDLGSVGLPEAAHRLSARPDGQRRPGDTKLTDQLAAKLSGRTTEGREPAPDWREQAALTPEDWLQRGAAAFAAGDLQAAKAAFHQAAEADELHDAWRVPFGLACVAAAQWDWEQVYRLTRPLLTIEGIGPRVCALHLEAALMMGRRLEAEVLAGTMVRQDPDCQPFVVETFQRFGYGNLVLQGLHS